MESEAQGTLESESRAGIRIKLESLSDEPGFAPMGVESEATLVFLLEFRCTVASMQPKGASGYVRLHLAHPCASESHHLDQQLGAAAGRVAHITPGSAQIYKPVTGPGI